MGQPSSLLGDKGEQGELRDTISKTGLKEWCPRGLRCGNPRQDGGKGTGDIYVAEKADEMEGQRNKHTGERREMIFSGSQNERSNTLEHGRARSTR